ncbi:MAG: hypothetical protein D6714_20025, partial [Bacteroidetes bacterium]
MNKFLFTQKKPGLFIAALAVSLLSFHGFASNVFMETFEETATVCMHDVLTPTESVANYAAFQLMDDGDCCEGSNKPQAVTLRYTGEDCGATHHSQASDKVNCDGDPNGAASVYIIANEKENPNDGKIWFTGTVALDGTFTVDAQNAGKSKLGSKTFVHIYASEGGALLQEIEFHTSCSQPLFIGDQFGSLLLEGIRFEDGTTCESTPPETCPEPVLHLSATTVCPGETIVFSTDDLGFPCFTYAWNFGPGASPQVATGIGPHTVTFTGSGAVQVALTVD